MTTSAFIIPSFPYAPGREPTGVEYELTSVSGEIWTMTTGMQESINMEIGDKIRYRFLWNGRPGAWSYQGVPWKMPR